MLAAIWASEGTDRCESSLCDTAGLGNAGEVDSELLREFSIGTVVGSGGESPEQTQGLSQGQTSQPAWLLFFDRQQKDG